MIVPIILYVELLYRSNEFSHPEGGELKIFLINFYTSRSVQKKSCWKDFISKASFIYEVFMKSHFPRNCILKTYISLPILYPKNVWIKALINFGLDTLSLLLMWYFEYLFFGSYSKILPRAIYIYKVADKPLLMAKFTRVKCKVVTWHDCGDT